MSGNGGDSGRAAGRRAAPVRRRMVAGAALAMAAWACGDPAPESGPADVSVPAAARERADPGERERMRSDPSWRAWAERDRSERGGAGSGAVGPAEAFEDEAPGEEKFEDMAPERVARAPSLPLRRSGAGPSILHVQILLDRADFSPGVLDGHWGKNTEKAVYWFQHARGLDATGRVDAATYAALAARNANGEPVFLYGVTRADLATPLRTLPDDVYEREELPCLCYETRVEQLAERFHTTPAVLERLNPGLDFEGLEDGAAFWAPRVERAAPGGATRGPVARVVVSKRGYYTHVLDEDGEILLHFPSTLGSLYDPSPTGRFRVTGVTFDPHFHYQPRLLPGPDDDDPEAVLPPGPNSPVGRVWIALSKPHYGIHGTAEPEMIGYTSSAGCVRLTNWDAVRLANHVRPGTPVVFR